MTFKKCIRIMAAFAVTVFFLSACGPKSLKLESISTSENPAEQINLLSNDISTAQRNQLNVFAPVSYARAEAALENARKGLKRGRSLSEILEEVAYGQAQLKRADELGKVVKTTLADVIKARENALDAGAVNFGKDYTKIENEFIELTKAIENNNLARAQRYRGRVARSFDEIELRAIKEQTLGEVERLLKQAEEEDAPEIAPKTFESVKKKLKEVDTFISENRYQKEKIRDMSSDVLFEAQRLIQVERQSKKVKEMEPEEIVLNFEEILQKMGSKLSTADMRNEPFKTQVENVLHSINALKDNHQFIVNKYNSQLIEAATLKRQIAVLEGKTRADQAEKEFQQLFDEVQSYFGQDEAYVYKQANQLVIRLKLIQFPPGKSVILPNNYELLSKVQRAISTFSEPVVIIEGHTDSTGSVAVNKRLSEERAEAVREYLIANKTLSEDKIFAVGYGSTRPLASNETAEGRAINRRIDLIIKPLSRKAGR